VTAYALRLENATDTAARVRLGDLLGLTPAGPLTARSGIRPAPGAGDVAVSAGTMQVTVQPFVAWVQGGVSAAQGGYPFVLDATKTLTLANGHATLSRTDVIAAVVHDDPYDGSALLDADVVVVTGTPGAGAPALPTNCLPLRNVTVPAGASSGTGGLTAGNLSTDRRTYVSGLGGVVTVASQAERDALPATNGTLAYRKDTDALEVRRGGAWERLIPETETAVRDTGLRDITAAADAGFRSSYPTSRVYVRRIGNVVYVNVSLKDNSAGAAVTVMSAAAAVFPAGVRQPDMTVVGGRRQAVGHAFNNNNGGVGGAQLLVTDGTFATDLAMYGLSAGSTATAQIVFTTTEAWPAVLPGTAA
jgi:hypothetical protein